MQRDDPLIDTTPAPNLASSIHASTAAMSNRPPPGLVTYKNPRRSSPENSVTLRHHRLAQEASRLNQLAARIAAAPPRIPAVNIPQPTSPRRGSSGESNGTSFSDPRKWFDGANTNKPGTADAFAMDVDPPFYQRETDSSNEDLGNGHMITSQSPAYRFVQNRAPPLHARATQSSSADDYRSVIDDLTVENKRLREELKRYKQIGPDALRSEKLLEVKVHGLPSRKRRELEATLRDFTQSLDGSSIGTSKRAKKSITKSKHVSSGISKHASSSSGSNTRPVDSAYASMSGPSSTSLSGNTKDTGSVQGSNQKIENYLRDIPEGLWPRANVLTEMDKKKLVVRRLERLFTGKMTRPDKHGERVMIPTQFPPISEDVEMTNLDTPSYNEPVVQQKESGPSREAQIRPQKPRANGGDHHGEGVVSNSRSREDLTESRDEGSGSGSGRHSGGNNSSPQDDSGTDQRPTRPRDLDPDRQQVPAENMEYIRHLGILAPESQKDFSSLDVSPDADGWVYLNLLSSLAQLHILNVAPDFVRGAVAEKSTMFQLSPDGRMIRWRGGDENTRFTSDGSGSASQRTQSGDDDTDGSNEINEQKSAVKGRGAVSPKTSGFRPKLTDADRSHSFHYQPLFVHRNTSASDDRQSGGDETGSSLGRDENSNAGGVSRWGQSDVSGGPSQRKRRRDGAIIYYQGAPFYTDLCGDYGDVSLDTYWATSSGDQVLTHESTSMSGRPCVSRSTSGSTLPFRPLVDGLPSYTTANTGSSSEVPELKSDETEDDDSCEANFEWSQNDQPQRWQKINLEASGLSGVYPEDHFQLAVSTRRFMDDEDDSEHSCKRRKRATSDCIAQRLVSMTTSSPVPILIANLDTGRIGIKYLSIKHQKLNPMPLPSPSYYFLAADDSEDDMDTETTSGLLSHRATGAAYPEGDALSSNDEEDEASDNEANYDASGSTSPDDADMLPAVTMLGMAGQGRVPLSMASGSSAATAGGAVSGTSSLREA
ncbi:Frequency clock protein [Microdochium nivale]|nr:Frequency clock protein [Microdochium nivale]